MANLDRPHRFTNKLKNHEIYACHVAGIVAANRLKSGIDYPGNLGKHEVGPIDIETMDEWLKDARALGFCIPSVSIKRNEPNSLNSPVIIIGAGPSGLAVAASQRRRNISCIVLEEQVDPEAFGAWNSHFSGLEVTTQKRFCSLPGFPMTDCTFPNEYVTAIEYQKYLRLYADRYGIILNRGCKVIEVVQGGQKSVWQVRYSQNQGENVILHASAVVVATGKYKVPKRGINDCILSKLEEMGIPTFHSSELKDDAIWDKALHAANSGSLCIVGFGNSSSDICAKVLSSCDPDMKNTAIHLAVRTVPPVFPREYGPLRLDTVGSILRMLPGPLQEVIIKSLWKRMPFSATVDKEFPRFLPRWNQIQGRVPVVDKFGVISTSLKTRRMLAHGPICDVKVDGILFHEGICATHPPIKINMVILATGYKADCIIAREDRMNGLFHIGLGKDRLLPIKSIGDDAEAISKEISNLFVK
jgi:Pyridine nucleotide-disulphide oxidoreductase